MPYPEDSLHPNEQLVLDLHPHWWFFAKSIAFGVLAVVVRLLVLLAEVERRGLAEDGAERVVVHLEGVGEHVVRVVDRRVVLAVTAFHGVVVGLERGDQPVERSAGVDGHAVDRIAAQGTMAPRPAARVPWWGVWPAVRARGRETR